MTWTHSFRYNIIFFPIFFPFLFFCFLKLKNKYLSNNKIIYLISVLITLGSIASSFQKKSIFDGFNFFKADGGYVANYEKVKNNIKSGDVILTNNSTYLKAFFDFKNIKIISIDELAPFKNNESSKKILSSLTKIWIDEGISKPRITVSMNAYIRYKNYILPFLNSKNYEFIDLGKLGKIYNIEN